jgi:hypothetical protein
MKVKNELTYVVYIVLPALVAAAVYANFAAS